MIADKKILIGVSGGIAAYKVLSLISTLVKNGNSVKVIMTESATQLVNPNSFRTISKNQVITSQFAEHTDPVPHVSLAKESDLMLIVPATANVIGKAANGIADDILTTTLIAFSKPVLFVPAMNTAMWNNTVVQENMNKLKSHGYSVLSPTSGYLACGDEGKGRLPDDVEIIRAMSALFHDQDMKGRKVLITSGGTREYLDDVRMITNASTGKMGAALANVAAMRGAEVTLVTTVENQSIHSLVKIVNVESAKEMLKAVDNEFGNNDIFISAAAVADYGIDRQQGKIKKDSNGDILTLELKKNPDILKNMAEKKKPHQVVIGFSLESDNLIKNAKEKLLSKNLDFIIANTPKAIGANESKISIISSGRTDELSGNKEYLADEIFDRIISN